MRPATRDDIAAIQEVERVADGRFAEIGMAAVADGEPASYASLAAAITLAAAWVEVDGDGPPVAYAFADVLDGQAHLEQLSVLPAYARRGIGSALVGAVEAWARDRGCRRVTLTTYAEVPWNAPFYRQLGFAVLPEDAWTPGLRERVVAESAAGLHAWPRVVMAKDV